MLILFTLLQDQWRGQPGADYLGSVLRRVGITDESAGGERIRPTSRICRRDWARREQRQGPLSYRSTRAAGVAMGFVSTVPFFHVRVISHIVLSLRYLQFCILLFR